MIPSSAAANRAAKKTRSRMPQSVTGDTIAAVAALGFAGEPLAADVSGVHVFRLGFARDPSPGRCESMRYDLPFEMETIIRDCPPTRMRRNVRAEWADGGRGAH
jgi:hypothetical protein